MYGQKGRNEMKYLKLNLTLIVLLAVLVAPSLMAVQLTNVTKDFSGLTGEGTLNVRVASGDVSVSVRKSTSVQVQVVNIDQRDTEHLKIYQEGNSVFVEFDPDNGRSDARFQITAPTAFHQDITTAGGDVSISGEVLGNIKAKTAGGDISTDDIGGDATLKTAGGDIRLGVAGGNAAVTTAGGDISAKSVVGTLEAKTSGGDIEVGDVGSELRATTAGGDIELGNVDGAASVATAGGDVILGDVAGQVEAKTAGGDIKLSSANGRVLAKTAGGDLDLRGVTGSIEGKTAGGDIVAELSPSGGEASELVTAGGDIQIYIPAGANVQIQARIKIHGNWERRSEELGIYQNSQNVGQKNASANEITATLGSSGPVIRLETSNGDIRINDQH
jgi:DUF4097 and DUF4098 domain-containing protein YvlB